MLDKAGQDAQHNLQLSLVDGLDHKTLIMRQKEEAATLARPFASLEDLVTVQLRQETLLDHAQGHLVTFEELTELIKLVVGDVRLSCYACHFILLSFLNISLCLLSLTFLWLGCPHRSATKSWMSVAGIVVLADVLRHGSSE